MLVSSWNHYTRSSRSVRQLLFAGDEFSFFTKLRNINSNSNSNSTELTYRPGSRLGESQVFNGIRQQHAHIVRGKQKWYVRLIGLVLISATESANAGTQLYRKPCPHI
jgi:hypothetical protein